MWRFLIIPSSIDVHTQKRVAMVSSFLELPSLLHPFNLSPLPSGPSACFFLLDALADVPVVPAISRRAWDPYPCHMPESDLSVTEFSPKKGVPLIQLTAPPSHSVLPPPPPSSIFPVHNQSQENYHNLGHVKSMSSTVAASMFAGKLVQAQEMPALTPCRLSLQTRHNFRLDVCMCLSP